jgi:hypothetical protein
MEMLEHVPDPASTISRLRPAAQTRWPLYFSPPSTAIPKPICSSSARNTCCDAAQGHARLPQVYPPLGTGKLGTIRRADCPASHWYALQSFVAPLLAKRWCSGQLFSPLPGSRQRLTPCRVRQLHSAVPSGSGNNPYAIIQTDQGRRWPTVNHCQPRPETNHSKRRASISAAKTTSPSAHRPV